MARLSLAGPNMGRRHFWGVIAIFLVLVSCTQEKRERGPVDSVEVPAAMGPAPSTLPPRDTAGSGAISWTAAGLQKRLREVGIDALAAGEVRQPFLGSPGTRFTLPNGELQAYIYADAGALSRDVDVLDTLRVSPPTMMIEWRLPPTLIVSNNLALILLTRDTGLRKQITDAVRPNLYRHDESARPAEAENTKKE